MIDVIRPGPFTTVQDLGRPPRPAMGVGRSGAADRASFRLANRLVGNAEDAAQLEMTLGGMTLRFGHAATVAVTGAPCPLELDTHPVAMHSRIRVPEGVSFHIGVPEGGLRTYLAVRGGVDVPEVLGSRSTDILAGLGLGQLQEGTRLPVGHMTDGSDAYLEIEVAPQRPFELEPVLRVIPGPRTDWFVGDALDVLVSTAYRATADVNRVGVRLEGEPLRRHILEELPSEGMVHGALQVPPSGQPALFLADHPMTGGYPVIAVVAEESLDLAAQLRAGQSVRFRRDPTDRPKEATRP